MLFRIEAEYLYLLLSACAFYTTYRRLSLAPSLQQLGVSSLQFRIAIPSEGHISRREFHCYIFLTNISLVTLEPFTLQASYHLSNACTFHLAAGYPDPSVLLKIFMLASLRGKVGIRNSKIRLTR